MIGLDMKTLHDKSVLPAFYKAIEGEEGIYEGFYAATTSMARIWISMRTAPIFGPSGVIRGGIGIVRDITEQKHAEVKLHERQRELFTLMSNLPGMAYRCKNDKDWTMEFVSYGCKNLTGHAPEDLIGNVRFSYNDLIYPEDRDAVWQGVQTGLAAQQPYQLIYRIIAADGTVKWVWEQGCGVFGDDNALIALEGFITDITERKRTEKALQDSEERFRNAFEYAALGIVLVRPDGEFIRVNSFFCDMVGYDEEELLSKKIKEITYPSDVDLDMQQHCNLMSRKIPFVWLEKRFIHKKGHIVHGMVSSALICDPTGGDLYFISHIQDITERKRVEKEIKKRIKELEEFYEVAIGRELRMVELKEEIERLKGKLPK